MKRASATDGRRCSGFTLLEITLVLGILVMLAAVGAMTIGRGYDRKRFDEGVSRFEATLRMTRVEAANQGRCFRVSFEDADGVTSVRVQWEAQPLVEPGRFSDYANLSTWSGYIPGDEIRILSCRLIGASVYRLAGDAEDKDEVELQTITFYSDGSSDSAIVIIAPSDENDAMRAAVRLDGVNATLQTLSVTDDELEENIQDIEQGLYMPGESGARQ